MSIQNEIKYIIYKRKVYVVKIGPIYLWNTTSSIRSECVRKALEHFNLKFERTLAYKDANIISLFIKEVVQENKSNKSV